MGKRMDKSALVAVFTNTQAEEMTPGKREQDVGLPVHARRKIDTSIDVLY